jgi:hypothetical protein
VTPAPAACPPADRAANEPGDGLDALRVAIGDLQRRVEVFEAVERRARPRVSDARVILAIAGAVGERVFSAAELLEHARIDAPLRRVLRGLTPRRLGKRLEAIASRPVGGFRVERCGREDSGTLWTLTAVSAPDLHRGAGAPRR